MSVNEKDKKDKDKESKPNPLISAKTQPAMLGKRESAFIYFKTPS